MRALDSPREPLPPNASSSHLHLSVRSQVASPHSESQRNSPAPSTTTESTVNGVCRQVASAPAAEPIATDSQSQGDMTLGTSPLPLASYDLASLPFTHQLTVGSPSMAEWCTPQRGRRGGEPAILVDATGSRTDAISFFSYLFPNLGESGVASMLSEETRYVRITCSKTTADAGTVALVSYRLYEIEGEVVAYVPLIGVDGGMATKAAYGSFADERSWRSRGFGKFLLHLVRQEARSRANGRVWRLELQSSDEMFGWYDRGGFVRHELSVPVGSTDGCRPMRWTPGVVGPAQSAPKLDAYARFLAGASATECGVKGEQLPTAWRQIEMRKIEMYDTGDTDLGWTVRSRERIEAYGYVFVYGGDLLTHDEAEQRVGSHQAALWYKGDVIDGIRVKELPPTHWGALPNSSKKPNAQLVKVLFGDKLHDVLLVRALSKDIEAGTPITIDYTVMDEGIINELVASMDNLVRSFSRAHRYFSIPSHSLSHPAHRWLSASGKEVLGQRRTPLGGRSQLTCFRTAR